MRKMKKAIKQAIKAALLWEQAQRRKEKQVLRDAGCVTAFEHQGHKGGKRS